MRLMNGSPLRKTCVTPFGGVLKMQKNIIGHHSDRISAGTASGVVLERSV